MAELQIQNIKFTAAKAVERDAPAPTLIGAYATPPVEGHYPDYAPSVDLGYTAFPKREQLGKGRGVITLPQCISTAIISYNQGVITPSQEEGGRPTIDYPPSDLDTHELIATALLSKHDNRAERAAAFIGPFVSVVEMPDTTKRLVIHDTKFARDSDMQFVIFEGDTVRGVQAHIDDFGIYAAREDSLVQVLPSSAVAVAFITGGRAQQTDKIIVIDADDDGTEQGELHIALNQLKIFAPKGLGTANRFSIAAVCFGNPRASVAAANVQAVQQAHADFIRQRDQGIEQSRAERRAQSRTAEGRAASRRKWGIAARIAGALGGLLAIQATPIVPAAGITYGAFWAVRKYVPRPLQRTVAAVAAGALLLGLGAQDFAAGYTGATPIVRHPVTWVAEQHYKYYAVQDNIPGLGWVINGLNNGEAALVAKVTRTDPGVAAAAGDGGDDTGTPGKFVIQTTGIDPNTNKPYEANFRLLGEEVPASTLSNGTIMNRAPEIDAQCVQPAELTNAEGEDLRRVGVKDIQAEGIDPKTVGCVTTAVLKPNPGAKK